MAKLLLVDDDPVLLDLLARLLRGAGHEVAVAGLGAECLAQAAVAPFDLIVSDVMMPDMDGYDLTRTLRSRPETRATPILLLTSGLRGPDREQALAAGADDFDVKTVNAARLTEKIERLARRGRPAAPGEEP